VYSFFAMQVPSSRSASGRRNTAFCLRELGLCHSYEHMCRRAHTAQWPLISARIRANEHGWCEIDQTIRMIGAGEQVHLPTQCGGGPPSGFVDQSHLLQVKDIARSRKALSRKGTQGSRPHASTLFRAQHVHWWRRDVLRTVSWWNSAALGALYR
jgi:hypothetical protein